MRNKALLKQACKSRGIPTSNFMVFDFQQSKPIDELVKELEHEIGNYPMFKKPIKGFGSGGGGSINNSDELKQWIEEMMGKPVVSIF